MAFGVPKTPFFPAAAGEGQIPLIHWNLVPDRKKACYSHSRDRAGRTSTVTAAVTERQLVPAASVPLRQHRDLQDRARQLGARSQRSNAAGSLLSLFRVCELQGVA
eukprot:scaffold74620_cov101-Phaeocystis_antarctica.AAC.7